uniref:(northern house mosquito) hypothetical protein n=1 Tax=Culex pipiens TaxID=7175 RepID=A0A8D8KQ83_CULPI
MFIRISLPLVTTDVCDSYQSLSINQLLSSFKRFDEVCNSQNVHRTISLALGWHGTAWWPLAVRLPSQNGTWEVHGCCLGLVINFHKEDAGISVGNNLHLKQAHRFYFIHE